MNTYKENVKSLMANDLMSYTIYWLGSDTQGVKRYGASGESWNEIFNELVDDGVIHCDLDEEELDLLFHLDEHVRDYVLSQTGNAYYQAWVETDCDGKVREKGGDTSWFWFMEEDE